MLCGMPDLNRGVQILKNVVEQNPMFVEARYHLAEALMRTSPTNPPQAERELIECLRLMDEEEKLGSTVDAKLRQHIQVALAKVKESIRDR